jgi:hypothetical protein
MHQQLVPDLSRRDAGQADLAQDSCKGNIPHTPEGIGVVIAAD